MNSNRLEKGMFRPLVMLLPVFTLVMLGSCNGSSAGTPPQRKVEVSGRGVVSSQPDQARFTVTCTALTPTTQASKQQVEQRVENILGVLSAEGVSKEGVKTLSLTFREEYEYQGNKRVIVGRRAEQCIVVTVGNLIAEPARLSVVLDKLVAADDRLEIGDIDFDIERKGELYRQSRALAFEKAKEKAQQYAELCGLKLGRVLSVSEVVSPDAGQARYSAKQMASNFAVAEAAGMGGDASLAHLPTGELQVMTEIAVVFELE